MPFLSSRQYIQFCVDLIFVALIKAIYPVDLSEAFGERTIKVLKRMSYGICGAPSFNEDNPKRYTHHIR